MPKKMAILVTTPKSQMATAAREARDRIEATKRLEGCGVYFRRFAQEPRGLDPGVRIFYVEDGYVRGFAVVDELSGIDEGEKGLVCETTGKDWSHGVYAIMRADSWKWVKPIRYRGFQGFRYFDDSKVEIVGGWLDPKPEVKG